MMEEGAQEDTVYVKMFSDKNVTVRVPVSRSAVKVTHFYYNLGTKGGWNNFPPDM